MNIIFSLGQIVMTKAVSESVPIGFIINLITRHASGDWGDLTKEDKQLNYEAYKNNERILGMYQTKYGKIYLITEWDRSMTTVLFAEEY